MINIRSLANSAIQSINPDTSIEWLQSDSYGVDEEFIQKSKYAPRLVFSGNVQSVSTSDIQHLYNGTQQEIARVIYFDGHAYPIVRENARGGDLFRFLGKIWLAVQGIEDWDRSGWCKIYVSMQQNEEQLDGP